MNPNFPARYQWTCSLHGRKKTTLIEVNTDSDRGLDEANPIEQLCKGPGPRQEHFAGAGANFGVLNLFQNTMDNTGDSSDIQSKARASAPIATRIAEESRPRPYRWGYFQGAVLVPWSLLLIVRTILEYLKPRPEPWYLTTIALLMGIPGLPHLACYERKHLPCFWFTPCSVFPFC
jgi:hypothetical protein